MDKNTKTKMKTFLIDGDAISVPYQYDAQWKIWIGAYPFFKDEPRLTPGGRPWRNAAYDECPHSIGRVYKDCGSCEYFRRVEPQDLIGVCFCEQERVKNTPS